VNKEQALQSAVNLLGRAERELEEGNTDDSVGWSIAADTYVNLARELPSSGEFEGPVGWRTFDNNPEAETKTP
jgi:hypothetical protein